MTYNNDPNSPYEPPPRDDSSGVWMALAIIVLIVLGGLVYAFTNRADQTANAPGAPVTTGSGTSDSRMAPPPPAPSK